MINSIIDFSIRNKLITSMLTLAIIVGGIWSMTKVPLDAVPDITNNQVQVITQAPNLGTEDIEQFVTFPVELAMANLPGVLEIRSISRFGLSVVTIVFEDDMETYLPRQLVSEKLAEVRDEIPEGFGNPAMGPISTGLGEIYQYTLQVDSAFRDQYSIQELRTMQDWIVRRQMALVPGVVEVNAFGGNRKVYEVAVIPDRLNSMGITITDIYTALENNNQNTGGAYIERNHQSHFIRGEGLARSIEDIEQIVVTTVNNIPVTISDVADVRLGEAVRYGAFTKDGQGEAVGGIIFMLKGSNSNNVIQAVKQRMAEIEESLPEGVTVEPFLDRSQLISNTTRTVSRNLIEGALIVIFVLVFLLGNWRGGLIVASTIPLSLLFAFILMNVFDVWANLMSLGAIDFGIIVDGAVIIVEGTVLVMSRKVLKGRNISGAERDEIALMSSKKMMNAAFFGQLIILIVFIPILALEGIEGKMFKPMALTFMFAMIGVMILCLTYVPMMSALFLRVNKKMKYSWGDRIVQTLENGYSKLVNPLLRRGKWIIGISVLCLALAVFTFSRLGGEFIPQLDEGDIAFHIILDPGSSLAESIATSTEIERILLDEFPEIEHALSRFGVADVPTDPMPMDLGDCFIILKPQDEWVSAKTKPELIEKIKAKLAHLPGLNFEFSQPIEMRFNELITGVREDIAIKIFGDDLDLLAEKAEEIGRIIAGIPGVGDMHVEATTGLPQMTVNYNRAKLAQYGLQVNHLNSVVETAFAGKSAGVVFEGERRFDLVVRLAGEERNSLENLRNLYIRLPNGNQIPLREVADIDYQSGPMQISRENTNRRVYVGINVRGRDVQSLAEEIKSELENRLELPPGYYIRYGGAFENLERANARLLVVVPAALALIFILIYFALRSMSQTVMIFMAIPLAAIGGIFSLWLRDMPFSISAGIGFIVLFGVAVLNGLVLISSWNELKEEGMNNLNERIRLGASRRVRPILLTALTDILGFLPMAVSGSAGAEVQRPLATVVIGGMITATLLTLFVLPVLYRWLEQRKKGSTPAAPLVVAIGLLFFLPATTATAQYHDPVPIALNDAVSRAAKNYPSIQAAQLEVENQQVLRKTSWDFGNTTVFTGGEELSSGGDGVYTVIGIQQQDIDIFGMGPKSKMNRQKVALAEAALDLSEAELIYQVKMSYIRLLTAQRRHELFEAMDSVFVKFRRAAELRYETEETSGLEFLAASNHAGQTSLARENALRDYHISLQQFNQWMLSDSLFTVAPEWENQPIEALSFADSLQHPILEIARRENELAGMMVKSSRSALFPKLNLQYGAQEINGQSGFYQFQAGISIPLVFNNEQGLLQSAKLKHKITEQHFLQSQIELNTRYQTAWEEYQKWLSAWEFYQNEALELAEKQRQGAWLAYREGALNYIGFLQLMTDAMELELRAWETYENYLSSKFQIEYLTGK